MPRRGRKERRHEGQAARRRAKEAAAANAQVSASSEAGRRSGARGVVLLTAWPSNVYIQARAQGDDSEHELAAGQSCAWTRAVLCKRTETGLLAAERHFEERCVLSCWRVGGEGPTEQAPAEPAWGGLRISVWVYRHRNGLTVLAYEVRAGDGGEDGRPGPGPFDLEVRPEVPMPVPNPHGLTVDATTPLVSLVLRQKRQATESATDGDGGDKEMETAAEMETETETEAKGKTKLEAGTETSHDPAPVAVIPCMIQGDLVELNEQCLRTISYNSSSSMIVACARPGCGGTSSSGEGPQYLAAIRPSRPATRALDALPVEGASGDTDATTATIATSSTSSSSSALFSSSAAVT